MFARFLASHDLDGWGFLLYVLLYLLLGIVVLTAWFTIRAIRKHLMSDPHFLVEILVVFLILFEVVISVLSLHLGSRDSEKQQAALNGLNTKMAQNVTDMHTTADTMRNLLTLLQDEHKQEMTDRAKKPILTLVTKGRINGVKGGAWHPPKGPIYLEDYTEQPCRRQPFQPGRRIFLGVRNTGDVKATDGYLTFLLPYGFKVKFQVRCSAVTCPSQPQDVHIPLGGTEVTVPFEVSPHGTTPITMEISGDYDLAPLVLTQMQMKTDQTDEQNLKPITIKTCLPQPPR